MEFVPPTLNRHDFFRLLGTGLGAVLLTHSAVGCTGPADENPTLSSARKIDFTLNLSDKANENLKNKGGYMVVNDVIVAHTKDGQFVALSSTCTHEQTRLVYRLADNQFYCPLDLSRFDITGKVIVGPATQALQPYIVIADALTGLIRVHS